MEGSVGETLVLKGLHGKKERLSDQAHPRLLGDDGQKDKPERSGEWRTTHCRGELSGTALLLGKVKMALLPSPGGVPKPAPIQTIQVPRSNGLRTSSKGGGGGRARSSRRDLTSKRAKKRFQRSVGGLPGRGDARTWAKARSVTVALGGPVAAPRAESRKKHRGSDASKHRAPSGERYLRGGRKGASRVGRRKKAVAQGGRLKFKSSLQEIALNFQKGDHLDPRTPKRSSPSWRPGKSQVKRDFSAKKLAMQTLGSIDSSKPRLAVLQCPGGMSAAI